MLKLIVTACASVLVLTNDVYGITPFQFTKRTYDVHTGQFWTGEPKVKVGDFDGNGTKDVLCVYRGDTAFYVLSNEGTGVLGPVVAHVWPGTQIEAALPADVDGNGFTDVVVISGKDLKIKIQVFANDGTGSLLRTSLSEVIGGDWWLDRPVAGGDLDHDGDIDLVMANRQSRSILIIKNDGDGHFAVYGSVPATPGNYREVALADLNSDNIPEVIIICADYPPSINVYKGLGNGEFGPAQSDTVYQHTPRLVSIGDFNSDGISDLAFSNWGLPKFVTILHNAGLLQFTLPINVSSPPDGSNAWGLAAIDLNEDGWDDLAATSTGAPWTMFLINQHDGTFNMAQGLQYVASDGGDIMAADLNADGLTDLVVGNSAQIGVMIKQSCTGDFDESGYSDISDLSLLISYLYLNGPPPDMWSANIDGAGTVDIADLSALIGYLYLNGSPPFCK